VIDLLVVVAPSPHYQLWLVIAHKQ